MKSQGNQPKVVRNTPWTTIKRSVCNLLQPLKGPRVDRKVIGKSALLRWFARYAYSTLHASHALSFWIMWLSLVTLTWNSVMKLHVQLFHAIVFKPWYKVYFNNLFKAFFATWFFVRRPVNRRMQISSWNIGVGRYRNRLLVLARLKLLSNERCYSLVMREMQEKSTPQEEVSPTCSNLVVRESHVQIIKVKNLKKMFRNENRFDFERFESAVNGLWKSRKTDSGSN